MRKDSFHTMSYFIIIISELAKFSFISYLLLKVTLYRKPVRVTVCEKCECIVRNINYNISNIKCWFKFVIAPIFRKELKVCNAENTTEKLPLCTTKNWGR